jgi:hypothetical protein
MKKLVFAIASLVFVAGCKDDVHVDLTNLQGPPGSSLQGDDLRLASGTALIVEARPKEDDGEASTVAVDLVAAEPFKAFKTTKKNRFVIVAERPGQATIRVVADGEDLRTLNADAF